MAKTRLQAKYDDDAAPGTSIPAPASTPRTKKKERYNGALDVLAQVYKQKGFAGWYQGMQAQITKAVLSQALLFGIKDALEACELVRSSLRLHYVARASMQNRRVQKADCVFSSVSFFPWADVVLGFLYWGRVTNTAVGLTHKK